MKKIFRYIVFLMAGIVFTTRVSFADGTGDIYDVFNNTSYKVVLRSKEIIPKVDYFKHEIDVTYFEINNNQTPVINKINAQIPEICTSFLTDNTKALDLYTELQERLKIFREIVNSDNYRYDYNTAAMPMLSDIESNAVSMVAGELLFKVNFTFRYNYTSNEYENTFSISRFYNANLQTGEITPWKNKFTSSQYAYLKDKLSDRLNKNYNLITSKLDLSDLALINEDEEDEEGNLIEKPEVCKDVCTRIDLEDAVFYWFAWGIIIEFQSYTYSSKIYYGNGFQLFIPFEEAKSIFSSLPGFSFINHLNYPATLVRNFNYWSYMQQLGEIRRPPEIENVLELNIFDKIPKTLVIERRQLFENGEGRNQNKSSYDFSKEGLLLCKRNFDENDKIYNSEFFTYDKQGNLVEHIKQDRNQEETSETFSYDEYNNLLVGKLISKDEVNDALYFYNGDHIYLYNTGDLLSERRNTITCYVMEGNEFCLDNMCYILNKNGKIKGIRSQKYVYQQGQIGRDKLGRMSESHFERDRYNYYWNYDNINRLASWQYYEYVNPSREMLFYYDGGSAFPYRRLDTRVSYGNSTILEELYDWTFF